MTGLAEPTRRDLIRKSAMGVVLASVVGAPAWMSPAQAAAASDGFAVRGHAEAACLAGLGEAIATPSRAAGLVNYVDHDLALPPADSLLALRYLDVPPPYAFYRPALAPLQRVHGAVPPASDPRWNAILAELNGPASTGWQ